MKFSRLKLMKLEQLRTENTIGLSSLLTTKCIKITSTYLQNKARKVQLCVSCELK